MYKKELEQFLNLRSKLNEFSRDFFDRYEMCVFLRRIAPLEPSIIDYVDNFLVDDRLGEWALCDSKALDYITQTYKLNDSDANNDIVETVKVAQFNYYRDLIEEDREILEELLKLCKGLASY